MAIRVQDIEKIAKLIKNVHLLKSGFCAEKNRQISRAKTAASNKFN
jgi:hypothetical protein